MKVEKAKAKKYLLILEIRSLRFICDIIGLTYRIVPYANTPTDQNEYLMLIFHISSYKLLFFIRSVKIKLNMSKFHD